MARFIRDLAEIRVRKTRVNILKDRHGTTPNAQWVASRLPNDGLAVEL